MSRLSVPDFAPLPLPPLPDPTAATFFQGSAADDLSALDASIDSLDHHLATAGDGLSSVTNANASLASSLADGAAALDSLINEQAADSVDAQLAESLAVEARIAAVADGSDSLLDPAPVFSYRAVPVLDAQPDLGNVPVVITPPPSGNGGTVHPPPPTPTPVGEPCPQGFARSSVSGPCEPIPPVPPPAGGGPIIQPPPPPPISVPRDAGCVAPAFVDAAGNCIALPVEGQCPEGFYPDAFGECLPIIGVWGECPQGFYDDGKGNCIPIPGFTGS